MDHNSQMDIIDEDALLEATEIKKDDSDNEEKAYVDEESGPGRNKRLFSKELR